MNPGDRGEMDLALGDCETVRQVRLDWKKSYATVEPSNGGPRTRKQTWPIAVISAWRVPSSAHLLVGGGPEKLSRY